MNYRLLALVFLASWTLTACGDDGHHTGDHDAAPVNCEAETRDDTYMAGLEKVSPNAGVKVVLVESTPAPPAKGDNTWRIRVLSSADEPLDNLTIEAVPVMPDHGHGTPIGANVSPLPEPGEYEITPVNLWMPGFWEVTISVADGANIDDQVVFSFCIEG